MSLDLDGLIPATVLPMDADGRIDEPALRAYIGWVVEQGPVALAINVDTGEGPHLTHDEKVRVLEIVRDVTDTPIVAGLAGPSTEAAVRQARDFGAAGADALLTFPIPAYLSEPLDPRVPVGYLSAVAEVGLPLILFQLQPALAGVNFEPETLRAMAAVEGVVAIKEASFDARRFVDTARLLERPAATDHAADRQRQLHPRVVHARRDRRPHRVRGGHDPRAGRHDRRVAGRPDRRGTRARRAGPAARRRRVRPAGRRLPGPPQGVPAHPRRARARPRPPRRCSRSPTRSGPTSRPSWPRSACCPRHPPPRSSDPSVTEGGGNGHGARGRPDHRGRRVRRRRRPSASPRRASASSASSRATGSTAPTTRATSSTGSSRRARTGRPARTSAGSRRTTRSSRTTRPSRRSCTTRSAGRRSSSPAPGRAPCPPTSASARSTASPTTGRSTTSSCCRTSTGPTATSACPGCPATRPTRPTPRTRRCRRCRSARPGSRSRAA